MSTSVSHRPATGRFLALRVDVVLVLSTLALAACGVVLVYSATRSNSVLLADGFSPHYFVSRQAAYALVGLVVMVVLVALDYRWLEHASTLLYLVMVLALLAMFSGIGHSALGATRWVQVGPVQIQPSSFATLVLIVTVATFCARRPNGLNRRDLAKVLALAALPIFLVVKQPDLGSGIVMCVVLLVMLVVAGIPNRYLVLLLFLAVLGGFAVLHLHLLKSYQLTRLTALFQHGKNLQTSGYNVTQSVAAIGSGGMWGSGLFHGSQTNLSYVPEQQTDFIFSAVGEQLGFIGSTLLLAMLGVIAWRLMRIAQLARDTFGRMLCAGAFAFVAFSTFQNAGMAMGIMPVAGVPLPFVSYGGSAALCFFAVIGIALSVRRHRGRHAS